MLSRDRWPRLPTSKATTFGVKLFVFRSDSKCWYFLTFISCASLILVSNGQVNSNTLIFFLALSIMTISGLSAVTKNEGGIVP